ncbi:hypothetical protein CCR97_19025 [Rhodoplanes elegans]|uniref:Uncharacterized protein n=1 Tax=Rhodoplanes elegans TaxID=29408 RepID=A0A327KRW8_9BRAD|nr:hypothetical protein [Rhodoplanes elegans]MBK5960278.1 hypothetical protein [Rhodoplanes elegans]RAI40726.1 hypothetical protein CH338_05410 [Rhodoplanes elegans]
MKDTKPVSAQDIAFDMEESLNAARDLVRAVMLAAGSLQVPERHAMFRLAEVIGERLEAVEDQRMQIVRLGHDGAPAAVESAPDPRATFTAMLGRLVLVDETLRARHVGPGFAYDGEAGDRVIALCSRLAGSYDENSRDDQDADQAIRDFAAAYGVDLDWLCTGTLTGLIVKAAAAKAGGAADA